MVATSNRVIISIATHKNQVLYKLVKCPSVMSVLDRKTR